MRKSLAATAAGVLLLGGVACSSSGAETPQAGRPKTGGTAAPASTSQPTLPEGRLHFTQNPNGDEQRLAELGFTLMDTGPDAVTAIPDGTQAMVWAGQAKCDEYEITFDEFKEHVDRLAAEPRVYGWYLSDEPEINKCPELAEEITKRATYIKRKAPHQKSFIVLLDTDYEPVRPEITKVDLFGLDPFPCRADGPRQCDMGLIKREFAKAKKAGIPPKQMVPVYQAFGQACATGDRSWRIPTEKEFQGIIDEFEKVIPGPAFDVSYGWGRQEDVACPSLKDADGSKGAPDLQRVITRHIKRT